MKTYVVLNPVAGNMDIAQVEASLNACLTGDYTFYQTESNDTVKVALRSALDEGYDKVIACGGDGTVSAVADALVNSRIPLGIVPVGTGNVLARELGIPTDIDEACRVAAAHSAVRRIDTMAVDGRAYISHISLGIYSKLIEHTTPENKQRFGRAAYVWAALKEIQTYPTWPFEIEADDETRTIEASMVIIANIGSVGIPPLRWGPGIFADDGRATVCAVTSATAADYFELIWKVMRGDFDEISQIEYVPVKRRATVCANDPDVNVRADGEIIGKNSVTVSVLPGSLDIVVPEVVLPAA